MSGSAEAARGGAQDLELGRFVSIALQLLAVLFLVHAFGVAETRGLLQLTPVVFAGFLVHAFAPNALRLPLFVGLSLLGFGLVIGFANVGILTKVLDEAKIGGATNVSVATKRAQG